MKITIIIPSRYESTRLLAKPLVKINNISMIERVYHIAKLAREEVLQNTSFTHLLENIDILVATNHEEIASLCRNKNIDYIMTSSTCPTGTDRVYDAILNYYSKDSIPDFIVNLQGDSPVMYPWAVAGVIEKFLNIQKDGTYTPYIPLTFEQVNQKIFEKTETPFSSTFAIVSQTKEKAIWFSKNIIPALRNANTENKTSPVNFHLGCYGYTWKTLSQFILLPQSHYEKIEGLEQLRMIENDIDIYMVKTFTQGLPIPIDIDSPQDVIRLEQNLFKFDFSL